MSTRLSRVLVGTLALTVLCGCSAPARPPHMTVAPYGAPTWQADDLASLLGEVQEELGPGSILTDKQIKANLANVHGGNLFWQSGATVSPGECETILRNDIPASPEDLGPGVAAIAADLNYGPTSISVSTTPAKPLPVDVIARIGIGIDNLVSTCSSINVDFPSGSGQQSVAIGFQKEFIPTDAEHTYVFQETVLGPTPTVVTSVRAVQGNLIIGVSSTQTDSTIFPMLVNAVVAAVRSHSFN